MPVKLYRDTTCKAPLGSCAFVYRREPPERIRLEQIMNEVRTLKAEEQERVRGLELEAQFLLQKKIDRKLWLEVKQVFQAFWQGLNT